MAWKHYLEVDCGQTFGFVNASIMEYLRLIFHFLYRNRGNPSLAAFEDIFVGFLELYETEGLLPLDSNVSDDKSDPTGKATLNFNDRAAVHDSVFATSANAMNNPEFDAVVERLNERDAPMFHYDNTYDNDSVDLSPAQGICQALQTVAGEVIRSATLLILECDEFLNTTPNDYAEQASRDLKKLIQTIKGMECNRKMYFTETQNAGAAGTILRFTPSGSISWFQYFQFFVIQVGISAPVVPAGHNYRPYAPILHNILDTIALRVLPLFQGAREMDVPPKPYYCTQNYLLYMSHLILTHCREGSRQVQFLQDYCSLYNSANRLNDGRISKARQERTDRREFEHRRGNFFYEERWRKAYWEQNRQLRRDGHMLYVYSQKTRNEGLYTHRADTETGQVPLYYNPTDASGYGDLSNHGPDHEFWRQGTRREQRAAAAAGADNPRADDRRAPAANAHGLPPRSTPHTRTAQAAPNPAQDSTEGRQASAPRTVPSSAARGAGNHAAAGEARAEGVIVDELEAKMRVRAEQYATTRMLLQSYEESDRDDETTRRFHISWEEHLRELDSINTGMDNAVEELKQQESPKLRAWKSEQKDRYRANSALTANYNELFPQTEHLPETVASPVLPRDAAPASHSRVKGLSAKVMKAVKHREQQETASRDSLEQTRAEEAIRNSGMRKTAVRQEHEIVEELELEILDRNSAFKDLKDTLDLFEHNPHNREESERLELQTFWEEFLTDLETLDEKMNTMVAELDPKSQNGKRFISERDMRAQSYAKLIAKFHREMAEPETAAAGS